MILFELMELKRPFEGTSIYQVMENVKQKNVKPLTRKTPEKLILIYRSILNGVRIFFYLLFLLLMLLYLLLFVLGSVPSS
jgi:hypothetical protein